MNKSLKAKTPDNVMLSGVSFWFQTFSMSIPNVAAIACLMGDSE